MPVRCGSRRLAAAYGHMTDRTRDSLVEWGSFARSAAFWPIGHSGLQNRRLSLRWFEANTCHHLRKQPLTSADAAGLFRFWVRLRTA